MIDFKDIIIILFLSLNFICFVIGYIVGKINRPIKETIYNINPIDNKINNQNSRINPIQIDSTKVVTKIDTDSLEKKYNKLGEIKTSQENIQSSVHKLKNMKG